MHGLGFRAFYQGDLRLAFGAPFLHTFYIQIFHSLHSTSDLIYVWRYQLSFQNIKIYLQPLSCAMTDKTRITKILITGEQKVLLRWNKKNFLWLLNGFLLVPWFLPSCIALQWLMNIWNLKSYIAVSYLVLTWIIFSWFYALKDIWFLIVKFIFRHWIEYSSSWTK